MHAAVRATLAFFMMAPLGVLAAVNDERKPETIPCKDGVGYEDPNLNHVNGAYVHSARTCQITCQSFHHCHYFTWNENTGACKLQGQNSQLVKMSGATSGPKWCNLKTTTGNVAVSTTLMPMTTAAMPAMQATTTRGVWFPGKAQPTTTTTTTTTVAKGFFAFIPWWGWMLIGLGAVSIGIALLVGLCCRGSSSGKDKRKKGSKKKVASQSGRQNLANKQRMDAAVEEMSRHSDEYNAMQGVETDMKSRLTPTQPLPSLPDPIPTVSAQMPTYSTVPQVGLLSTPQLPMASAQRAMSVMPSPLPQAVMQPISSIGLALGSSPPGMQPMGFGPLPMGSASSGRYMPVRQW